jgi:hypothetical protein
MIANSKDGWDEMLPKGIAETIKKQKLFGYKPKAMAKKDN